MTPEIAGLEARISHLRARCEVRPEDEGAQRALTIAENQYLRAENRRLHGLVARLRRAILELTRGRK